MPSSWPIATGTATRFTSIWTWRAPWTQRLLIVLSLAYEALDRGGVLWVDELDASLHTHAAEAVLKLFLYARHELGKARSLSQPRTTRI